MSHQAENIKNAMVVALNTTTALKYLIDGQNTACCVLTVNSTPGGSSNLHYNSSLHIYFTNHQATQDQSGGVTMAGDARFDSPGYSAKYCTYYMQVSFHVSHYNAKRRGATANFN